jgi:ethanolamine utilization protein EutQ (cupin superfamily)
MAVVVKKAATIRPVPFDVGEGKLHIVDAVARPEGAPVTAGICEIWKAAPVEFHYDNYCGTWYLLDGHITLTEDGKRFEVEPGDVVFIPQRQGLKVLFDTPSYGKFFFVTSPHWR